MVFTHAEWEGGGVLPLSRCLGYEDVPEPVTGQGLENGGVLQREERS